MKRNLFKFVVIAVLLMATTVSSCQRDKAVTGVTLNYKTLELIIDEPFLLIETVEPKDATNKLVRWESSNPDVATVVRGNVTAKSVGIATITVITEDGEHTAFCDVEVVLPLPPTDPIETMIEVKGGVFTMGCTDGACNTNERPNFPVKLSSYYIGKYPVTQKEWKAIMRNNPSHFKGDDLPVENMSFDDIVSFLEKLNEIYKPFPDSLAIPKYRLATEAEWEFAARGGKDSRGYKFSGSNNINAVAWFSDNSGNGQVNERRTHPVGTKEPNELGIYDMSGNVWEWCNDLWGSYEDKAIRTGYDPALDMWVNPQGPIVGGLHVARGGSWIDFPQFCRVAARTFPTVNHNSLGFRLAISAE